MEIKALALDLDGTLTNSQKQITPATRRALDEALQRGVKIILASGRPAAGVQPVARELGLHQKGGYILAYNGGQIIDCGTGRTLRQIWLPPQYIAPVCAFARERGLTTLAYGQGEIVTENDRDPYVQKAAWINRLPVRQVEDLPAAIDWPTSKIMVVGPPPATGAAAEALRVRFAGELNFFHSEPFFLEVVPVTVEKSLALDFLLGQLGLRRQELMACGDGINDLSMLRWAGWGVAMENAHPAVKQAADAVTLTNDQDGVAAAVQKYILGAAGRPDTSDTEE